MSATSQDVSGFTWSLEEPLAFRAPGRDQGGIVADGPLRTARLRLRRFLEAWKGARWRKPPSGGGPGNEGPPEPTLVDECWSDPALWMLMFH